MFARDHDIILFYTKNPHGGKDSGKHTFRSIYEKRDKPVKQLKRKWDAETGRIVNKKGEDGKVMWEEKTDRKIDDVWRLPYIVPASSEGLGYPTQKPIKLLKRILEASTNPGDVVLDPFCGCGTTIMAAQELGRQWLGIDVTAVATSLIEARLKDVYNLDPGPKADYDLIGVPTTESEAETLASQNKYEFEKWAISLVPRAMPWQEKKGADGGVDGFVRFRFNALQRSTELVIISVKGGQTVKMDDIKNLEATMTANKAVLGFFISLVPPTKGIVEWAQNVGLVKSPEGGAPVPAIQIRTVGQLLRGEAFQFPWNASISGIARAGSGQMTIDSYSQGYDEDRRDEN